MKTGQIIFFNGATSSGKTTLAKVLQEKLDEPYMYVSVDDFINLYPEKYLNPTNQEEMQITWQLILNVISGMNKSLAALAKTGNNINLDHLLQEEGWLEDCVESWQGLDVLFIGLRCPLEVLEQREKERGDRNIGNARYQFDRVHRHGIYDLELDTSVLDVDECVNRIMLLISEKPGETAFEKLQYQMSLAE